MKIAIQGETGSFSHLVALQWESHSHHEIVSCKSFSEVFKNLQTSSCDLAIVPIENSLTGRIGQTTNLFIEVSNLQVIAEEYLPVSHCLMTSNKAGIKNVHDIKKIYGHPEALSQCMNFLSILDAIIVSFYDGAAAREYIENDHSAALIASRHMAGLFNLQIITKDIQDLAWNQTRFFVVQRLMNNLSKIDSEIRYKTSIIFSGSHVPGSLSKILDIFASKGINLTRVESIPSRMTRWQYIFLLDFEGHADQEVITAALSEIRSLTRFLKVLGSYPSKSFHKEERRIGVSSPLTM